jgi:hypothetical protein
MNAGGGGGAPVGRVVLGMREPDEREAEGPQPRADDGQAPLIPLPAVSR